MKYQNFHPPYAISQTEANPHRPLLNVEHLSFKYSKPILNAVSLSAFDGDLITILGANGAGKSTLLKIIVGLQKLQTGKVEIDGRELAKLSGKKLARLIGYVPQDTTLKFPITATEFVLQGRFAYGNLIGFESDEDIREAERAMDLTETTHLSACLMNELSGGERQRLMLARALAIRPRILVLDEPVANLDIAHQVKLFELVKRLTVEDRIAAIVVTHELNLAAEFSTQALLLKAGEVLAFGNPCEVMNEENLSVLFGANLFIDKNPLSGLPRITIASAQNRSTVLHHQR
ncbi:MAG: ABC transporter ATP-binding protein [Acidobacteriota bacterium]